MVPEPSAMPFMRSAFADLLEPLDRRAVARAVGAHGGDHGDGAALIRLLDATPIALRDARFAWAEASARIRGLKLHLLYDPRQGRPVWFEVSSAKRDDVVAGRTVPLEAGATYVFDKGYTDYRWWSEIQAAGAFFVTLKMKNAPCREIEERAATGD